MSQRIILCTSDCGYSWVESLDSARSEINTAGDWDAFDPVWTAGFSLYIGDGLDAEIDVLVDTVPGFRDCAAARANAAFVLHHDREQQNEPSGHHSADGQLSFWRRRNPFTILRSYCSW